MIRLEQIAPEPVGTEREERRALVDRADQAALERDQPPQLVGLAPDEQAHVDALALVDVKVRSSDSMSISVV